MAKKHQWKLLRKARKSKIMNSCHCLVFWILILYQIEIANKNHLLISDSISQIRKISKYMAAPIWRNLRQILSRAVRKEREIRKRVAIPIFWFGIWHIWHFVLSFVYNFSAVSWGRWIQRRKKNKKKDNTKCLMVIVFTGKRNIKVRKIREN